MYTSNAKIKKKLAIIKNLALVHKGPDAEIGGA